MNPGPKHWSGFCSFIAIAVLFWQPLVALAPGSQAYLSPPERVYPPHRAYIGSESITFRWQPVEGAFRYRLELVRAGGGEHTGSDIAQQSGHAALDVWTWRSEYTVQNLLPEVTYLWCVTAVSYSGQEGQPCRHFYEVTTSSQPMAPPAPEAIFASEGRYHDRVRLFWYAAARATSYQIERAYPDGDSPLIVGEAQDVFFEDTSADPGQRYDYTIRACNEAGCGPPSPSDRGWAGMCSLIATPAPLLPDGSTLILPRGGRLTLTWTAVEDAREYEYQLEYLSGPQLDVEIGGSNEASVEVLVSTAGEYRWRIRALDPTIGCPGGAWSDYHAFRLAEPVPYSAISWR